MNNDYHKYRVWDDETKEYVSRWVFVNYRGEVCRNENGAIYPHKCVVEECTGKRDRNGRLIGEGSWVRCYLNGKPFGTYLVKYDERSGAFYYFAGDQEGSQSFEDFDEVEVVGHIHEQEGNREQ